MTGVRGWPFVGFVLPLVLLAVQAVVDHFAPVDFILRSRDQPTETDDPKGRGYQLPGGR